MSRRVRYVARVYKTSMGMQICGGVGFFYQVEVKSVGGMWGGGCSFLRRAEESVFGV